MTAIQEKVSIIMPAYNADSYIREAILSVQKQTWKNWELIVIDDGSSDHTVQTVTEFSSKDSRIHLLQNSSNLGAAASRNHGILYATGFWIAFLDSDDAWDSNKLTHQIHYAHQKQAIFTFTGSAFMDPSGEPLDAYLHAPETVQFRQLLKQNVISCSSVLIKRDLILPYPMAKSGFMHEDFATWLMILRDYKIAAYGLDEPLLIYRLSPTSSSGNKRKAAQMTFRVYRYIGLPWCIALYYWLWYAGKSLFKYRKLK